MHVMQTRGIIPQIIRNDDGLYDGDLRYYFKIAFNAKNVQAPYHNFRHMLHVTMLCTSALEFYKGTRYELSGREARELLIAGLFHDFDHTGRTGNDDLNIEYALRGLEKHLLLHDQPSIDRIRGMIKGTQFPYVIDASALSLGGKILRDADASQAFSVAWIQQVIFGLAEEMGTTPLQVLQSQKKFLGKIEFHTDWAKFMFKESGQIEEKIREAEDFLEFLE